MSSKIKIETVNGEPIEEYGYKREFVDAPDYLSLACVLHTVIYQCVGVRDREKYSSEQVFAGFDIDVTFVDEREKRQSVTFNTRRDLPGLSYMLEGKTNNAGFHFVLPDLLKQEVKFTVVEDGESFVLHHIDLKTGEQREFSREPALHLGIKPEARFGNWEGRTAMQEASDALRMLNRMAKKFTPTVYDVAGAVDYFFNTWEQRYEWYKFCEESLVGDYVSQANIEAQEELEP